MASNKPVIHARDHYRGGADWHIIPKAYLFTIDAFGAEIIPGVKGDVAITLDCDIIGWTLLADQAGDIVVDVWKADFASYPPTVADTITAGAPPTLTGSDHEEDVLLVDWTTRLYAGDTLRINVDSASTVTQVHLALAIKH